MKSPAERSFGYTVTVVVAVVIFVVIGIVGNLFVRLPTGRIF